MTGRLSTARHGRSATDLARLFRWLNAPAPTPGASVLQSALARDALRLPLPSLEEQLDTSGGLDSLEMGP